MSLFCPKEYPREDLHIFSLEHWNIPVIIFDNDSKLSLSLCPFYSLLPIDSKFVKRL